MRENGYYWVMDKGKDGKEICRIAEYYDFGWHVIGVSTVFDDIHFDEIGEKIERNDKLRDYFAGQALIGIVMANASTGLRITDIKADCWIIADAALSGRDEKVERKEKQ